MSLQATSDEHVHLTSHEVKSKLKKVSDYNNNYCS